MDTNVNLPNQKQNNQIYIGCADWNIRKPFHKYFPGEGTHLERFAKVLNAVEIDSTFYKPHRVDTYVRWQLKVPDNFRFAIKMPKEITHIRRLIDFDEPLGAFLEQISHLGMKLGPVLIQLPPNLAFQSQSAEKFFHSFRQAYNGYAVCEPRNKSWFNKNVDELLQNYQISRAAVNPAVVPQASRPEGWHGLAYYRLHGTPQIYTSSYTEEELSGLAKVLQPVSLSKPTWCIFNNTAQGAATLNALFLANLLAK